ncbi:putative NAD-dependent epimerase/dehydratase [Toxoplasma gondii RUB]|uniref:Putative NAD-dependent epimerase/dehydratase n=1 Tax=Toxoplasma gondii RUB TaxID=935652 RepID=A0A086LQN4_TOXGO|nr:putative NAD-dependent epimerase/dehydratase [Toxoplasma gondii RUB]
MWFSAVSTGAPRSPGTSQDAGETSADPVDCTDHTGGADVSPGKDGKFAEAPPATEELDEKQTFCSKFVTKTLRADPSSSTCTSGVDLESEDTILQIRGRGTGSLSLTKFDISETSPATILGPEAAASAGPSKSATLPSLEKTDETDADCEVRPDLVAGSVLLSRPSQTLSALQSRKEDEELAHLLRDTLQPRSLRVLVVGCGGRLGRLVFKRLLHVNQDSHRRWLHVTGVARNASARAALMKEEPQLCRSDIVVCDIRNAASVREVFGLSRTSHASSAPSGQTLSQRQALYRHAWVRYQQIRVHAKRALLATPPGPGRRVMAEQYKSRLEEVERRLLVIQPSESFFDAVVICTSSRLAPIREVPSAVSSYSFFSTATTGLGPAFQGTAESESSHGCCPPGDYCAKRSEGRRRTRLSLFRRSTELHARKSSLRATPEAAGAQRGGAGEVQAAGEGARPTGRQATGKPIRSYSSVVRTESPEEAQSGVDKISRSLHDITLAPASQCETSPCRRTGLLIWPRRWKPFSRAGRLVARVGRRNSAQKEKPNSDERTRKLKVEASSNGALDRESDRKKEPPAVVEEAGSCEAQAPSKVNRDGESSWKPRRCSLEGRETEVEGSTKCVLPQGLVYDYVGGGPREIDWLGQKNIVDAAREGAAMHVVLCSIMGGTDPKHHLNQLGQQRSKIRRGESGGDILLWKRLSERYLLKSGLSYTVVHPGSLSDAPGGSGLVVGINDSLESMPAKTVSRSDVANVLVHSLLDPSYLDQSFDVLNAPPKSRSTCQLDTESLELWNLMNQLPEAKYDYRSSEADLLLTAHEQAQERRASVEQVLADHATRRR